MNISTALSSGAEILQQAEIAESRREAASLLAFVLQKDAAFLIAHPEFEMSADEAGRFEQYLNRRANHEPFQYIAGWQEFYGLDFEVSPDVLIPRPETEILVEQAINILSQIESPHFFEIGVGSGCISVSILANVTYATAVGVDISENALAVARSNAEKHNVDQRLKLQQADLFTGLEQRFDLIVSNPPYIPREDIENLQAEVRDFEPLNALTDEKDGLSIIEKIITDAPKFLSANGFLLLEIGFEQAETVREMFDAQIWQTVEILPDLQGIGRMVKARA